MVPLLNSLSLSHGKNSAITARAYLERCNAKNSTLKVVLPMEGGLIVCHNTQSK